MALTRSGHARFVDGLPLSRFARVELEIGSARGDLLCDLALWHPHHFYIGVDIDPIVCERALALIATRRLENVVIVNGEAYAFLSRDIPSQLLDAIHIYHPSPVPVQTRLLTPAFEREVFRTLQSWGTLRILTDDGDYYDSITKLFARAHWWEVPWLRDEFALRRDAFAGSPVEMKYRAEGATLYPLQLTRLAAIRMMP
jgi:tRNA G46 methylase TrmB